MIVNRLQSMHRARRRLASVTFYAQTFQKPARYFCYCPTGPSRRAGRGGSPRGGCVQHWRVCPVVFWRVVWYLRGRDRINVVPVVPVRRAWSCMAVVAVAVPWLCPSVVPWPWRRGFASLCVVATRRRTLVFPMVLMTSHYPGLHNQLIVCIVIAIKQTTTEGTEMKRSPPRRPPPQGR